jgi:hypothetical protein
MLEARGAFYLGKHMEVMELCPLWLAAKLSCQPPDSDLQLLLFPSLPRKRT